jgi:hypothetical protein
MDKLYGFLAMKIFSSNSSNLRDNRNGLVVLACVILHLS